MASTYTTSKTDAGTATHDFKPGVNGVTATFDLAVDGGGALVDEDIIQMVRVPKGARVLDLKLSCTDLDTNVTPTIILEVGDGADDNRYIAGSVIGQTGGTAELGAGITTNTMAFTYTANDTIDVRVSTVPATGAATGTITLAVLYTTDL